MDKVSIIIVTYNAANDLQNCLDSIKEQITTPLEVIVVDGASKDDTVKIIQENSDIITKWISEKDNGIYHAMNKALKLISGKWVYFLGADDTILPAFSEMIQELKDNHTIYYGTVLAKGTQYLGYLSAYNQAKTGICHQSMIYPARVFEKYSFDEKYRISADHHLNMKCWADPALKVQYLDCTIANFNHTGISSLQKDPLFEKDKAFLILKYFGLPIFFRFIFRELKWKIHNSRRKNS
ncbi:glycosyltransferase [Pedobacter sp. PAMC26386]|nr:glycosyltransferase [Pedobacter sp. PAMC26386]